MDIEPHVPVLLTGIDIAFKPFTTGILFGISAVVVLLFFSAAISGSEIAFFSIGPSEKSDLEVRQGKKPGLVLKLLKEPERLLATILISNNFINVGIIIISSYITYSIIDFSKSAVLGFIFQVIVITFILLLFGEILPKIFANHNPLSFSCAMAFPLYYLKEFFKPVSTFLIRSGNLVSQKLRKKRQNLSMDEISDALELTSDDIKEDKNILEGIVKFSNIDVKEIMKPRIDVVATDIKAKPGNLIKMVVDSGYSRIPVYEETFDNTRGILYIKDLLPHLHKKDNFKWQSLIRPPYFVPENKKISDLLHEFQMKKIHMAIVVDEFGGANGIITLEDIIEEIVGDIIDESDEKEILYTQIDGQNYLFNGKILLNDFYRIIDAPDDIFREVKGDADTLAGLILELKGEIPARGEVIPYRNLKFIIEAVDRRRIKSIKVTIKKPFE